MLTGLNIAVIGGDARQLEVIRKLTELGAKIWMAGFDQLDHGFAGAAKAKMNEIDFSVIHAIILPVPGTSLNGTIDTVFSNEEIMISEEWLSKTPENTVIYSGISNAFLDQVLKTAKRKHIQLLERDDVAIYNSIPTVEGTIMMVIQNTDFTIHGSNVCVLGLGRVGMSVARTFAALGAKVKVGARKSSHIARIEEMGLASFHLNHIVKEASGSDICINTIPHMILTPAVLSELPSHALVIDLASKPGGTDFKFAEKRGIKAMLAPGLPGIVAPKTAGQILANVLTQLLAEQLKEGKESSS
ncbi:dipicolinic acid synthetase subunit A [Metabacillus sp. KIGAM252]|uniref:Dipicolinic acid synthetase subunit A n=1 Tax=Metabacillus flavus TaxID=2823519 RepID=A0ABS5LF64_9BACI|nr:dipicolinic acid synthetase subunit A [Metabacillus flavus]MBS2969034.1 dipicolinic acid synthetase subunit A [Metabacillus flavus]